MERPGPREGKLWVEGFRASGKGTGSPWGSPHPTHLQARTARPGEEPAPAGKRAGGPGFAPGPGSWCCRGQLLLARGLCALGGGGGAEHVGSWGVRGKGGAGCPPGCPAARAPGGLCGLGLRRGGRARAAVEDRQVPVPWRVRLTRAGRLGASGLGHGQVDSAVGRAGQVRARPERAVPGLSPDLSAAGHLNRRPAGCALLGIPRTALRLRRAR